MLKLLSLLLLVFVSSVEADVNDTYFCASVRNISVSGDETQEYAPRAFSFFWYADDAIRLSNYEFNLFGVKKSGAETFAGSDLEVGGYHSIVFTEGAFKHVSLANHPVEHQVMNYILANCEKAPSSFFNLLQK